MVAFLHLTSMTRGSRRAKSQILMRSSEGRAENGRNESEGFVAGVEVAGGGLRVIISMGRDWSR